TPRSCSTRRTTSPRSSTRPVNMLQREKIPAGKATKENEEKSPRRTGPRRLLQTHANHLRFRAATDQGDELRARGILHDLLQLRHRRAEGGRGLPINLADQVPLLQARRVGGTVGLHKFRDHAL